MPLTPATFAAALRAGFYFCEHCGRIVLEIAALAVDPFNPGFASCPHCHKRTCVWHGPTLPPPPIQPC